VGELPHSAGAEDADGGVEYLVPARGHSRTLHP
jgi:hypothetical protein